MAVAAPYEIEHSEVFARRLAFDTLVDLVGYAPEADLTGSQLSEPYGRSVQDAARAAGRARGPPSLPRTRSTL